jgi:hypothetical protein
MEKGSLLHHRVIVKLSFLRMCTFPLISFETFREIFYDILYWNENVS